MVKTNINTLLVASISFVSIFGVYEGRAMGTKEQVQEENSYLLSLWTGIQTAWNNFNEKADKHAQAHVKAVRRQQKADVQQIAKVLQNIGFSAKVEGDQLDKNNVKESTTAQKENVTSTN